MMVTDFGTVLCNLDINLGELQSFTSGYMLMLLRDSHRLSFDQCDLLAIDYIFCYLSTCAHGEHADKTAIHIMHVYIE